MIVIGLDGKEHKFNYSKYKDRENREGKSSHHKEARELLKNLFPFYNAYEEVTLPGKDIMYADFFIPQLSLVVEVHGEQHYSYIPYFHESKADFAKSKKKDKDKIEFCRLNNFCIAVLPYNEKESWSKTISEAMSQS